MLFKILICLFLANLKKMIRKDLIEYKSAVYALFAYLKHTPDPRYAFDHFIKDIGHILGAMLMKNAHLAGMDFSSKQDAQHQTRGFHFIDLDDYTLGVHPGLKLISSTDALRAKNMRMEDYYEYKAYKGSKHDPSLENVYQNQAFKDQVKKALEGSARGSFEIKINKTTTLNLFYPIFSCTADFLVTSNSRDPIAVIEHKACGTKDKKTLAPMISNGRSQVLSQMISLNVNLGLLAIEDKNTNSHTMSLYTSECADMAEFVESYLRSEIGQLSNRTESLLDKFEQQYWLDAANKAGVERKAGRPKKGLAIGPGSPTGESKAPTNPRKSKRHSLEKRSPQKKKPGPPEMTEHQD